MAGKRYRLLGVLVALIVAGCTANPAPDGKKVGGEAVYELTGMEISKVASKMGDTLYSTLSARLEMDARQAVMHRAGGVPAKTVFPTVAVTSFVDMDTYEDAGYLGRQLGEMFIHELTRRTVPVFEFKITGNITVTKTGEFVFSRDWKKIARRAQVAHVLAGTITRNEHGVVLVARIINMETAAVLGSATGFVPYHLLPFCYRSAQKDCTLDGVESFSGDPKQSTTAEIHLRRSLLGAGGAVAGQAAGDPAATGRKEDLPASAVIHDGLRADPRFRESYYPHGAKYAGTSTGNYEEHVYDNELNNHPLARRTKTPLVYPAATYEYNERIVRDVHDQSQYERVRNQ